MDSSALLTAPLSPWAELRPHPQQSRLYRTKARFNVVEAGRRSGKTAVLKRRGVMDGLYTNPGLPDFLVVFGAPTRDQAKHIFWDDLKRLVPQEAIRQIREADLTISTKVGTTFAAVGMDRPERIEGRPVDIGNYDEFAEYKAGTFAKTIRPCASTDGRPGRVFMFGVPRPSAQFAELARIAQEDKTGEWAYHHWTAASVLDPREIASARASMDERTFAQEYEASRVNVAGRAYYCFDRASHLFDSLPYNDRAPLILTLDFNVEPGTATILQEHVEESGHEFTDALGEIWIPNDSNTPRVCRKFIADWGAHKGEVIVDGDPAGGARHTEATEGTDWEVVRKILGAHFGDRLRIEHKRRAPLVNVRVNALNSRLRTADGKVHFRLLRGKTSHLALDLDNVAWKVGAHGELEKKKDPSLTHPSDGVGYYVERVHPLAEGFIEVRSW